MTNDQKFQLVQQLLDKNRHPVEIIETINQIDRGVFQAVTVELDDQSINISIPLCYTNPAQHLGSTV